MSGQSVVRLLVCLGLCLGIGIVAGQATASAIATWYATLIRPSWTPPNWLFPIAWTVLYVLMAVSLWRLWDRAATAPLRRRAMVLFFVQLALNAAWSPVFFALRQPRAALGIIVAMILAIGATIAAAWRVDRIAAWLLVPYFIWVLYATSLNVGIVVLNP